MNSTRYFSSPFRNAERFSILHILPVDVENCFHEVVKIRDCPQSQIKWFRSISESNLNYFAPLRKLLTCSPPGSLTLMRRLGPNYNGGHFDTEYAPMTCHETSSSLID
jgi:hypothetical protein